MNACLCGHGRQRHGVHRSSRCFDCKCRKFREQLTLPAVDLIAELESLRRERHRVLSEAEFEFFKVERALEAAKRRKREEHMKWQSDVREFHREMGLTIGETPAIREPELRARLILEEAYETVVGLLGSRRSHDVVHDAFYRWWNMKDVAPSLPDVADGIADLIYVAFGTAVACGIDLAPIWGAVHASNMAKKDGPIDENGKKRKPPGWVPPDVEGELRKQGWKP
jgi:predicted HAD superfamily Cof-like phosphohydrolase